MTPLEARYMYVSLSLFVVKSYSNYVDSANAEATIHFLNPSSDSLCYMPERSEVKG
jgi:hypothetical protein